LGDMTTVLSRQDILNLIKSDRPLIEDYRDLNTQLQPNGIDFTVREVAMTQTMGRITVDNSQRLVSELAPLVFDGLGYLELMPGAYIITYNEIVHLPNNIMAISQPRSSLLRSGVTVYGAVWDAGYSGRSRAMMVVFNPRGFRLQKDAAIVQLVFMRLTGDTEGYSGTYQGENIN
jgi:dUTP pyrophosphatase